MKLTGWYEMYDIDPNLTFVFTVNSTPEQKVQYITGVNQKIKAYLRTFKGLDYANKIISIYGLMSTIDPVKKPKSLKNLEKILEYLVYTKIMKALHSELEKTIILENT